MLIIENIAILNGYLKKIGSDSEFPRGRLQSSRWAERAFCGKKKHKANKPIRSMGYCKRSLIRHGRSCRNGYFLSGNKNIATHQSELRYWLRLLAAGVPGRIRTSGLRSRSPALYPAELRVHNYFFCRTHTVYFPMISQNQLRCNKKGHFSCPIFTIPWKENPVILDFWVPQKTYLAYFPLQSCLGS